MKRLTIIAILLFLSACGTPGGERTFTEENAPSPMDYSIDRDAVMRINEIKNGATPKVAPGGKSTPLPPLPPAGSPVSSKNAMPNENLSAEYKHALIKTSLGEIKVDLYADKSPKTVNNFLSLAKQGLYDGTRFHRVIYDFMVQGGDPLSKDIGQKELWGTGGPGYKFEDEINDAPLQKGSLAMANSGPNTNGSQFFIVTKDFTPWLDGKHTNFGFVTEGLDVVEKIQSVETDANDRPREDVVVNSIELIP